MNTAVIEMRQATIYQLNVSRGGVPKRPIEVGEITKGGLLGDRQAQGDIHGGRYRALSLFPLELIEALAAEGHRISPGSVGENVTTRGLDWSRLGPGTCLRLGADALIKISSYAAPCQTISASFSDGNVSRLNQQVAPGRSRLCAEVLREGIIRPGDSITIENDPAGEATMPKNLQLWYVNVYVTDLERSVEFFHKTLGLEIQFSDTKFGYASVDAGPIRVGLARIDPKDEASRALVGRHTGVGFGVPDLKAAHAALVAEGVSFSMEPSKQPWGGFMALFADPDGNVFYLDEMDAS